MNVYIQWAETCLTCRHTVEWHMDPTGLPGGAEECQHPPGDAEYTTVAVCKCKQYRPGGTHQLVWAGRMTPLAPAVPMD